MTGIATPRLKMPMNGLAVAISDFANIDRVWAQGTVFQTLLSGRHAMTSYVGSSAL